MSYADAATLVSTVPCSWICQLVPGCGCQCVPVEEASGVDGGGVLGGGAIGGVLGAEDASGADGLLDAVLGVPFGAPLDIPLIFGADGGAGGSTLPRQAPAEAASAVSAVRTAGSLRLGMH